MSRKGCRYIAERRGAAVGSVYAAGSRKPIAADASGEPPGIQNVPSLSVFRYMNIGMPERKHVIRV